MRKTLGYIVAAFAVAVPLAAVNVPTAQAVDYDTYSYEAVTHFDDDPTGEDVNVDRFRVRDFFRRDADGFGWYVTGITADGWEKGNNPQDYDRCGDYMQWIEVVSIRILSGPNYDNLVWTGGGRDLKDSNGCDASWLDGTAQVNVQSRHMRISVTYNAHVALRNDFNNERFYKTYDIVDLDSQTRSCTFVTGHGDYCDTIGPYAGTKRPPNG